MKSIADSLTMAGLPILDDDFVMQLLVGLLLNYDAAVANINSNHAITVEEVL